ncbi:MAG: mechanosensitive ion channel family protein, partial [Planctomycetota bacterium]
MLESLPEMLESLPEMSHLPIAVAVLLLLAALGLLISRRLILPVIRHMTARSSAHWDDHIVKHGFFNHLAALVPALICYYGAFLITRLSLTGGMTTASTITARIISSVALASMVVIAARCIASLLNAVGEVYAHGPRARQRPIKGYLTIVKILIYAAAGITAFSLLINKSPVIFLSGLGAMTAVLLLVFRDTILSLVAAIQLSSNDMLRIGDWIEMPDAEANGDVFDIALHTVKVQNWDKTITTIPTHMLISSSFKNWRGMQESGGRRIQRSIYIDIETIRFLDDEDLDRFGRFALLKHYIASKRADIAAHNKSAQYDPDTIVNARRLTNLGTFRAWVDAYLRAKPEINQEMMFLVRH